MRSIALTKVTLVRRDLLDQRATLVCKAPLVPLVLRGRKATRVTLALLGNKDCKERRVKKAMLARRARRVTLDLLARKVTRELHSPQPAPITLRMVVSHSACRESHYLLFPAMS